MVPEELNQVNKPKSVGVLIGGEFEFLVNISLLRFFSGRMKQKMSLKF